MSIQKPELIGSFVKIWDKDFGLMPYVPASLIALITVLGNAIVIERTIDKSGDVPLTVGWHEDENELQKMLIKFIKDVQGMEDEAPVPAPQQVTDHGDEPDVDPFQILR